MTFHGKRGVSLSGGWGWHPISLQDAAHCEPRHCPLADGSPYGSTSGLERCGVRMRIWRLRAARTRTARRFNVSPMSGRGEPSKPRQARSGARYYCVCRSLRTAASVVKLEAENGFRAYKVEGENDLTTVGTLPCLSCSSPRFPPSHRPLVPSPSPSRSQGTTASYLSSPVPRAKSTVSERHLQANDATSLRLAS